MALAPFLAQPEVDSLLIYLSALCGCIVVIGLIYVARAFLRGIFAVAESGVSWIPWVGKVIKTDIKKVEQRMISSLASAEAYFDAKIGSYFHSLVKTLLWAVAEFKRHSHLLWILSNVLLGPEVTYLINHAIGLVRREINHAAARLHALERSVVGTLPHDLAALRHWTTHRLRAIEGTLDHAIDWSIPRLRSRTRTLEKEYDSLWHKVRRLDKLLGAAAFAAAVSVALSRLGFGWIKCDKVGKVGRRLCGLGPRALEDLLGLLVDAVILQDICQVIKILQDGLSFIEPEITGFVTAVETWACYGDNEHPPRLDPIGLSLPAFTGVSLSLPG